MITMNLDRKQTNRNIGETVKETHRTLRHAEMSSLTRMQDPSFDRSVDAAAPLEPGQIDGNWVQKGIQPAIHSMNDWSAMQKSLRAYPERVKARLHEIEKQFAVYRLAYTTNHYKAARVEDDILGVYKTILDTIPRLEQRTKKRPLFMHVNSGLRDLSQAWENLSTLQDALSRLLELGPRKMDFYNRMLIYRDEKRRVAVQRRQNESRINAAYEAIRKALSFVDRQTQDEAPIAFGTEILPTDDAKHVWSSAIESLLDLCSTGTATTETIVRQMRLLEETIRDFPSLSKQVQRTGERFARR